MLIQDAKCTLFHPSLCGNLPACPAQCRRKEFFEEYLEEDLSVKKMVIVDAEVIP